MQFNFKIKFYHCVPVYSELVLSICIKFGLAWPGPSQNAESVGQARPGRAGPGQARPGFRTCPSVSLLKRSQFYLQYFVL